MCFSRQFTKTHGIDLTDPEIDNINRAASSGGSEKELLTQYRSFVVSGKVHLWVLPLNISQSRYGGRGKPSSACTLITIQIAHDILKHNIQLPSTDCSEEQDLPMNCLEVLVNAIVDGNDTHGRAMDARRLGFSGILKKADLDNDNYRRKHASLFLRTLVKNSPRDTFTVPEAIQVHQPQIHEMDYRGYSGNFLSNLISAFYMVLESPLLQSLDVIPIGLLAYERAVCFIIDRRSSTICLFDSHMHFKGRVGSVISVAAIEDLETFLTVVMKCIFPEVFRTKNLKGRQKIQQFEITCLMLTSINDKVYKGKIFTPFGPLRLLKPIIKEPKIASIPPVLENESTDSGYESS